MLKTTRKRTWKIEELEIAVKTSFSRRQVLSKLKLREAGGNYAQIKKYIEEYKLDTTHFYGMGWNKGRKGFKKPRFTLDQILTENNTFQSYKLKKRLFEAGLKPQHCEHCGWCQRTVDGRLPLELDHINGDRYDNRIENLRILCPNCHSLTPTYRARNRIKK